MTSFYQRIFYFRLAKHYVWLLPVLLVVLGAAVYAPAVGGVFVLDDRSHIYESQRFAELLPLSKYVGRRGLMDLTLALNYAVGGVSPRGYHVVNIVIHLLASLTLFGLMRRLLCLPQWSAALRERATELAFFIAAIWMVHPLLTQAVSYVIQRGESMAGLFVLLSAYALVRLHGCARVEKQAVWTGVWSGACVLAMVCAVWTKESAVTAAIGLILLDFALLAGSMKQVVVRRWWVHVILVGTMGLPFLGGMGELKVLSFGQVTTGVTTTSTATGTGTAAGTEIGTAVGQVVQHPASLHELPSIMTLDQYPTAGFGMPGMTWKQYFFTQPAVICYYLKLAYWPGWLSLEHNWRPMSTPMAGWLGWRAMDLYLAFSFLVTLAVLSMWGLWRLPWLGLAGCWFFLSLGVTSSFIPINDLAVEHRMYLAMVSVVSVTVLGCWQVTLLKCRWWPVWSDVLVRASVVMAVVVMAGLGVRTFVRNMDYRSELALWEGAFEGQEPNARVRLNYGSSLYEAGRKEEAAAQFERALTLRPGDGNALINLGSMYFNRRELGEAEKYYKQALRMAPRSARACVFLSRVYRRRGEAGAALEMLEKANVYEPGNREIMNSLASVQFGLGQYDDAAATYEQVLTIDEATRTGHARTGHASTGHAGARQTGATLTNLGMVKVAQQKLDEAQALFVRATEVEPGFGPGWEQLARNEARLGRFKESLTALNRAIAVAPELRLQQQLAMLLSHCPDPAVRDVDRAMTIVGQGLQMTQRQDISWLEVAGKVALAAGRPDLALQAEADALVIAVNRGAPERVIAQGKAEVARLRAMVNQMQRQGTLER